MTLPFSDEQYRQWAREAILDSAKEATDWGGLGEQFADQWDGLSEADFNRARQRVYDLTIAADIAITWPEPEPEAPAPTDVDHEPYLSAVSDALGKVAWLDVTEFHADGYGPRSGYIEVSTPSRRPLGLGWSEERGWFCGTVTDNGLSNVVDMGLPLVAAPAEVVQAVRLRLALPDPPGWWRSHEEEDPELERALSAYHQQTEDDRG